MTGLGMLIRRNCKLFFKDKGMFYTSLITPLILLVLYICFLGNVYRVSFRSAMPEGLSIDETLIGGIVGGQLMSSLLAVCCVTVAFCSNLLMVQDKVTGARKDLTMAPIKNSVLSFSYYVSSAIVTLIICFVALFASFIYLNFVGWYLSVGDVLLLIADVVLLVTFGTALSSVVNCKLSTNGQASAVGTIISSVYGFICGAYMPISNFPKGLQKVLSFLPGTYGTSLLRNHALGGAFKKFETLGFPSQVIDSIKDSVDCNLYFFGSRVSIDSKYMILIITSVLLTLLYVAISLRKKHA